MRQGHDGYDIVLTFHDSLPSSIHRCGRADSLAASARARDETVFDTQHRHHLAKVTRIFAATRENGNSVTRSRTRSTARIEPSIRESAAG